MELNQEVGTDLEANDRLISLEECRKYLGDFELSDQRIIEIRNSLIGIVDRALNSYLETFE